MPVEPLVCAHTATRVSSVLNRDVKQFGKQHLFDGSEETCWNSDQVSQLHIQFQGGFSSRLCTLEGCRTGEELVKISELYPQDSHAMQVPGGGDGAGQAENHLWEQHGFLREGGGLSPGGAGGEALGGDPGAVPSLGALNTPRGGSLSPEVTLVRLWWGTGVEWDQ
ncbi:nuclear receptor 2C2-associated protein isoform X1 [Pyrgilauda ruficollis]|uniref:nuclear receptor 2C2-associated protein isoform X1 n=1 Tax=Pyrgilauda ruficollis TaxID=221976 RepID=UPI001B862B77|nr:nuclear receptor 2C2-associated protein isoform X1 [Pyrgilauda ruficollis]